MNLTERAEIRKETFYKLTNSADVPEVPNAGGRNYVTNLATNWQNKYVITNGASAEPGSFSQQSSTTRISPKNFIAVKAKEQYTISLKELTDADYYFKVTMSTVNAYGVANSMLNKDEWIYSDSYTFMAPENCKYIMISVGCDSGVTPDDLDAKFNIKLERGSLASDYSLAPEDYDSDITKISSEIKQTTDAITASVSSVQATANAALAGVNTLDKTTVKSASLTINTDGIVMKAGKSTTDVANAIGSYFAVNQDAINLFADKIKVKGDMIVNGAITADKIRAGSITADMFKGNQITSLNGATTLNLYTGEIIFNNQNATINQIKGSYKSQISLFSLDDGAVTEGAWSSVNTLAFNSTKLTSATRRAGSTVDMFPNFSLMTLYGEKIAFTGETSGAPGPQNAIIVNTNSDEVRQINGLTNSSKGAWNYSMIMNFGTNAAISAPDIKLAGHIKSLTGILDDLCKKVGIMWI